jgi:hypothetical protein
VNIYFLLAGILIVVLSILYLFHTILSAQKDKDYDYWILSFDIKIVFGTLVFLVLGLIMIYREIKHFF